ncbi:MAG TPA: RtcB family protein [Longimicrobiaceae bacterium]|nr:RtcB family protein [Longimicrobiaceae bacterium]
MPQKLSDGTTVFGQHDESTLRQAQDVATRAERVALMADGHVGYVMPIGGVAAYRNRVSVVGVGFDIACLAAGTPVTTRDGYFLPIEQVLPEDPVMCWDGERVRPVVPHLGAIARGRRPVRKLHLSNGRVLHATADHEILTHTGWRPAGDLLPGDAVACPVFVGLPHVRDERDVPVALPTKVEQDLSSRGLFPLRSSDPRFPALLRLLGYASGDGHLSKDGKRLSIYLFDELDAQDVVEDVRRIGFEPRTYRRTRKEGYREENHVSVGSRSLHALFAALGSPVGKKNWAESPMPWLLDLPPWLRAQFLSAFCSAEMMTPRVHRNGTIPNLQLKQAGDHVNGISFIAELFRSLGFAVSVAPSGVQRGARITSVLQILGGREEQLRFMQEVGFCYSTEKRERAAIAASITWQGISFARNRDLAKCEARRLRHQGVGWRTVIADVSSTFGVPGGFVYHAMYDDRGPSRRLPGAAVSPDTTGEVCWVPVDRLEEAGEHPVYDIVTGDPAHCFLAAGIVVHNCGNAAIRTDLTLEQLSGGMTLEEVRSNPHRFSQNRRVRELADQIAGEVSFGIGRKNRADDAPVDHPLFNDPAWYAIPNRGSYRDDLREKARRQLGTVGSGNHYVDVFADEAGTVWVGVHFGSRGFGHTVASGFLALGQGRDWGERVPEKEVLLELEAPVGHDYWQLMELAGRYAYAGREWVARKVVSILGGREVELVHNHHNFAWKEEHDGEEYVVVRKGATPAFPGQKGFIGGSMGDDAVIVRGTPAENADAGTLRVQREALFSTVHGAGRVMSRTAAAGKRNRKTGRVITPGRVTPEMMKEWVSGRGVVLRGGGLDESPHVYRRLPEVLAEQGTTVETLHTLRPLIVVMAGADEFDPYKD